ncbi:MAG: hypothetical protein JXB36_17160 [Gammaproteobacteria bacterium]|nr:hypothetical protein [Gammaproteobacteria bacterium]
MAIRQEEERYDAARQRLEPTESGSGSPRSDEGDEALAGAPEPWEPWETRLVVWSLGIGFAGLLVLGWLVDRFILS